MKRPSREFFIWSVLLAFASFGIYRQVSFDMSMNTFFDLAVLLMLANVIIAIHLTGHFVASRCGGIGIEMVSVGIGPKMFGFSRNGTLWKICLVPIGGYIRLLAASQDDGALGKKVIAILGGPFFNIVFSYGTFSILLALNGVPMFENNEIVTIHLSAIDALIVAAHQIGATWTSWVNDVVGFNLVPIPLGESFLGTSPARILWLLATWSSYFGILNLLPIRGLDGVKVLRLVLASYTSPDRAATIMKWGIRFVIALVVLLMLFVTWNDIVHL